MSFTPLNNHTRGGSKVGGLRTVFEGQVKTRVGGGNVDLAQLPDFPNVLPMGTPIYHDEEKRTVDVHYEFGLYEAASSTKIKVAKGPEGTRIKVGMVLIPEQETMETGAATAYTVKTVDSSNADYDLVTLSASLTLAADKVLWEANATAADGKYYVKVKPNGLTDVDLVKTPGTYAIEVSSVYFSAYPIMLRRLPALCKVTRKYMQQEEFCYFNWAEHK